MKDRPCCLQIKSAVHEEIKHDKIIILQSDWCCRREREGEGVGEREGGREREMKGRKKRLDRWQIAIDR